MPGQSAPVPQARKGHSPGLRHRVSNYYVQHITVGRESLRQLAESPIASLMTVAVIGLALSLPALLFVGVGNGQALAEHWQGQGDITVFLTPEVQQSGADNLADLLRNQTETVNVTTVSPEAALKELESLTGFAAAVEGLNHNPLPWLVVVELKGNLAENEILTLLDRIQAEPGVAMAQFDLAWLGRLNAALGIARTGSVVIAFLLSMTVLLVVGNTIRLDIENRRTQIEITRLVGGSDGFVRRPFLYAGLWYGLSGGIVAAVLVFLAVLLLSAPVDAMTELYGSQFALAGLGTSGFLILCGAGSIIGLVGAWISVGRHLRMIEPA